MEQVFSKHLHPAGWRGVVYAPPDGEGFELVVLEWTREGEAVHYLREKSNTDHWCLNPQDWRTVGELTEKPATEIVNLAEIDRYREGIAAGFDERVARFRAEQEQRQERQAYAAQTTQGPLAFADAPPPESVRVKAQELPPFRIEFDPADGAWTLDLAGEWSVVERHMSGALGATQRRTKIEIVRQQVGD